MARTWPQSANVVFVFRRRPLASTSPMTIWTEAWSLEVMRRSRYMRSVHLHACICVSSLKTHWSPRTCGGRKDRRGLPKIAIFAQKFVHYIANALLAYLIVLHFALVYMLETFACTEFVVYQFHKLADGKRQCPINCTAVLTVLSAFFLF